MSYRFLSLVSKLNAFSLEIRRESKDTTASFRNMLPPSSSTGSLRRPWQPGCDLKRWSWGLALRRSMLAGPGSSTSPVRRGRRAGGVGSQIFCCVQAPGNTTDYQNHDFCRLPIISIWGFITGTYNNDGFGCQWCSRESSLLWSTMPRRFPEAVAPAAQGEADGSRSFLEQSWKLSEAPFQE